MAYEENLLIWYRCTLDLITERINETKGKNLTSEEVGLIISNHYNFTDNTEFFDLVCTKGIMLYHDIEQLFMLEFELPDFAEITENGQRLLLEKTVKHNGIWRIHKSDPDNIFPSDPHGDRVDAREKLNLYNGFVYSLPDKIHVRTLPNKAMKYIYNQLMKCKEVEITGKLTANKNLITYL